MKITWTNCADAMPPGNTCLVIRKFQGIIKRQQSWILRTCASFHPELYEWTPYTPEKWKELNK